MPTPVDPEDIEAEYVPTQILADLFKQNGYEGIVYKSSLGDENNIALFDLEAADPLWVKLVEILAVNYGFKEHE